jgi:hypothetical protein
VDMPSAYQVQMVCLFFFSFEWIWD